MVVVSHPTRLLAAPSVSWHERRGRILGESRQTEYGGGIIEEKRPDFVQGLAVLQAGNLNTMYIHSTLRIYHKISLPV